MKKRADPERFFEIESVHGKRVPKILHRLKQKNKFETKCKGISKILKLSNRGVGSFSQLNFSPFKGKKLSGKKPNS